jgi:hypothetical protein
MTLVRLASCCLFFLLVATNSGQVVNVSAKLDTNVVLLGQSTVLRVFAQVAPEFRADADRILSWYIDVLNGDPAIASLDFVAMQTSASDNDPLLSSTGTTDNSQGQRRRGIHNTFLNRAAAGTGQPVELLAIPVKTLAAGQAQFQILAGTGVPALTSDFVVAQKNDKPPLAGGEYSAAGVSFFVDSAIVFVSDITVLEGNAGSSDAVFNLSLSKPSSQPIPINFATANGSATAGSDYTAAASSITFSPGTTNQTITVKILGDTVQEPTEFFVLNLTGVEGATLARDQATATILDNDAAIPSISVLDASIIEGNSGSVDLVFAVVLSSSSPQPVTVAYATLNNTAIAGIDYLATNNTLTFPSGSTTQSITVRVIPELLNEASDQFFLKLSNPAGATLNRAQATGTIHNDDPLPTLSVNDITLLESSNGTPTNAVFTITLSPFSGQTVTVNFSTANGTALAGADYSSTNGILTFEPGTTTQKISVTIIDNSVSEGQENFFLNLSNPGNATVGKGQALATITDDDPLPILEIIPATTTESDTGAVDAIFTVKLSKASDQPVSAEYTTSDISAKAGLDYAPAVGTLTFSPGTTSQTIAVEILPDLLNEAVETFQLKLSNPLNASIKTTQASGTITDNDPPPSVTITDAAVVEGNSGTVDAIFTVILSAPSGQTVTLNYATANDTAIAGTDYATASGVLTFPPGLISQVLAVKVTGDTSFEANETFFLNLTLPGGVPAALMRPKAQAIIFNDDPPPATSMTAGPDPIVAGKDAPRILPISDLLGNDVGAAPLRITAFNASAAQGRVTDNGNGTFSYDPTGQFASLSRGQTASDKFQYIVTDSTGATATGEVTVTIVWTAQPLIESITFTSPGYTFVVSGLPGVPYTVQSTETLNSNWQDIVTRQVGPNRTFQVADSSAIKPKRFYKVIVH